MKLINAPVVWFTGISGSGKTTVSRALQLHLEASGLDVICLDGDDLRQGLCADLGFGVADRKENMRRASELAKFLRARGTTVIVSLISPFKMSRQKAKELIGPDKFLEVYCSCPLEVCESRDAKGLYARWRAADFADSMNPHKPYEVPEAPDCVIETNKLTIEQSVDAVLVTLRSRELLLG